MAFVSRGLFSPLVLLVTAILVSYYINGSNGSRYTASVFEFKPYSPAQGVNLNRSQALDYMKRNIETYKKQVRIVGKKGNDIIVFPEYGLFGIFGYAKYARRSHIYPFLETIPDPKKVLWNPCLETISRYSSTEIQKELSCMAKVYDIYVVANVGEKVACKKRDDPRCPSDGRYQFNTNVVYSSNGTLVAKYRKKHLFQENHYDSPLKTEIVTFNTHFGKFGLLTSYDSLFKSPIIDLVHQYNVREIVMPNAWINSEPLFSGIQWHSSLAQGLEINLLVATVDDIHCKSYGSGIYGQDGAIDYFFEPNKSEEKMLSKSVRSMNYYTPRKQIPVIPRLPISQTKTYNHSMAFLNKNVTFTFIDLSRTSDEITICHGRFCCRINYTVNDRSIEKYALAVYKGKVRTLGYLLEVEVCAVVRCSKECGQPIKRAYTYFDKFHLVGVNFSTPYIYPQVLTLSGSEAVLATYQWLYNHSQIIFTKTPEHPLHSASLIGRVYDSDEVDYRSYATKKYDKSTHENYASAQCISSFILIVAFIASMIFSS